MFLAAEGAAPMAAGCATTRAMERRASIVDIVFEEICWVCTVGRSVGHSRLCICLFPRHRSLNFGISDLESDLDNQSLQLSYHKMASEEPLFDPSLKKRKKKAVVFIEDPLGAEADPTKPAPETIDSTTINGESVDLGPTTAHELMAQSSEAKSEKKDKEEEDYKAMFGDMKKKKKKKEIPMDFVRFSLHDVHISASGLISGL